VAKEIQIRIQLTDEKKEGILLKKAAPAQRLVYFVHGKLSPVLNSAPLHFLLPKVIGSILRK
jgi:hypothetical protein